jgi:hypothetical protein
LAHKHNTELSEFAKDAQFMNACYDKVFQSDHLIPLDYMWLFLSISHEGDKYQYAHKDLLMMFDAQSAEKNILETTSIMQLRCHLLKHLSFLINQQGADFQKIGINKQRFCFLLREGFGTMDILPNVSLSMSELTSVSLPKRIFEKISKR